MRWTALLEDLEAQASALERAERDGEVDERARIEVARLTLVDRLTPAGGAELRLRCAGGFAMGGALSQLGPDWLLLVAANGSEYLVSLPYVVAVSGLGRHSATPSSSGMVESRLRITYALRRLARDRCPGQLWLTDGSALDATIDRVGADFIEVAAHAVGERRRRSEVRDVQLVPLSALVAVRRDSG